jgi:flavin-dependent dehydrogenase
VKPTTGGGIYYGLLCADLAAQTLDGALRSGRLCGKDLSGYERAWKATLGDELRTGQWARKLYERLSDRRIDRILATLSSGGLIEEILSRDDVSFDWHGRSLRHLLTYRTLAKLIGGL